MPFSLPIEPEAAKLLNDSPLALLLGMLLDQQIPLEKAFSSPYVLRQRLGHDLDAREIADYDPEAFEAIVAKPPALHRFPRANAKRMQELCQVLVSRYEAAAANVWAGVDDGAELVRRVGELPGFGKQKSQIFVALLGKQLGVRPDGWREASGPFGAEGSHLSVADIVDEHTLGMVRSYKQHLKAAAKDSAAKDSAAKK
jgi:uncharacterized HhH-GPD family protein